MRIVPCLLLFLGGCFAVLACSRPDTAQGMNSTAPLEVDPPFLDLGAITFGARAQGTYHLHNASAQALRIRRIGPFACQCVSAELVLPWRKGDLARQRLDGRRLDLELAPDEDMEIHFTLDTARYRKPTSRKVGSIPIVFDQYPGMILQWGADIWTPFAVEPWSIDLHEVGVRERAQGRALVVAHDTQAFGLQVDLVDEDGWEVHSRLVDNPDKLLTYELKFTAPEVLPEGPFQKDFVFHTDLPGAPPVKVSVRGLALPDLGFSPSRLVFDPNRGKLKAELRIVQRSQILNWEDFDFSRLAAQGVELLQHESTPRGDFVLQLRYSGASSSELHNFTLEIPTPDPSTPVLEIPVTVMPTK